MSEILFNMTREILLLQATMQFSFCYINSHYIENDFFGNFPKISKDFQRYLEECFRTFSEKFLKIVEGNLLKTSEETQKCLNHIHQ